MSLAVKYRPKVWSDVVEQESVVKVLSKQLETRQFKNAYIFSGASGCGKTTNARIFANEINRGLGTPIEIDAASNSGVENMRTIIKSASERALDCEYKIIIVDECHSLSNQAWQALLLTIEETPKYTIFIFCTTNPEKIPATIINRCQRFSFTRISTDGIKRRLCQILYNENVGETMKDRDEVTDYIARISKGEMRNAITMLETVIDAGSVDIETCVRVLGSYSYDDYINLTNYLLDGNLTGVSSVINFVYSSGVDMKLFTNTYLSFIMDVLKYCYSRNISNTKIPVNFENEIIKLVDFDNSANYYQYYMDNLLKLKNMIKGDDDPLTTIEIVFNQIGRLI